MTDAETKRPSRYPTPVVLDAAMLDPYTRIAARLIGAPRPPSDALIAAAEMEAQNGR